jgi:hypothetical protein
MNDLVQGAERGSGSTWELLNNKLLDIVAIPEVSAQIFGKIFYAGGLRPTMLDDKFYGFYSKGSNIDILFVLVIKHTDIKSAMNRVLETEKTFAGLGEQVAHGALHSEYVRVLTEYIVLGQCRDFPYLLPSPTSFVQAHIAGGKASPEYKFVSNETQNTGATKTFLKSIRTHFNNEELPLSNPNVQRASVVDTYDRHSQSNKMFASADAKIKAIYAEDSEGGSGGDYVAATRPGGNSNQPVDRYAYIDGEEKSFKVFPPGPAEMPTSFEVGGTKKVRIDTAEHIVNGTAFQGFSSQMLMTTPTITFPSSSFTPNPGLISTLTSPSSVLSDPYMLIGIVALLATGKQKEEKFTYRYVNLPTTVIDNKGLNTRLYGEE